MRKFIFVIFFLLLIVNSKTVFATSWVELDPQEVLDRAEVIVIGKYDFTSKPKTSDFVFQGLEFNVTSVYKGTVYEKVTAGIDYNDVGWAEDFQENGGEFLLLLEKTEDANFLIPIAGPNGMIQLTNGKVVEFNEDKKTFYENFINTPHSEEIREDKVESQMEENVDSNENSYISLVVLAGIALVVFIFTFRYKKKK